MKTNLRTSIALALLALFSRASHRAPPSDMGELVVNDGEQSTGQLHVNVHTAINSKQITRQHLEGRDYYVLPSYTLPANVVMNRVLYPASEIDRHYKGLEGTLAPLGHPVVNGKPVSATTQQGLVNYCGAANRNVQKMGDRIYLEKWVDIEQAKLSTNGNRLLSRIEKIIDGSDTTPIHTSVALFINRKPAAESNGGYDHVAEFLKMDHDAILLDEPGAATPEQGVGLMVNCDLATQLTINEGLLQGVELNARIRQVSDAAREHFNPGGDRDTWIYVSGITMDQVVVGTDDGQASKIYGYAIESGKVKFTGDGIAVREKTFWEPIVNKVLKFINPQNDKSAQSENMKMTPAEQAAFMAEVKTTIGASVSTAISGIETKVNELAANQNKLAEQISAAPAAAAQAAKESAMKADVAKVHGEVVANALSGEALAEMHSKLGTAAAIAANNAKKAPAAPDYAAHFGDGQ